MPTLEGSNDGEIEHTVVQDDAVKTIYNMEGRYGVRYNINHVSGNMVNITNLHNNLQSQFSEKNIGDTPRQTYEAAETAFWTMYNSRVETLDTGMANSWKGDMDSILIFAGLFSAVLTTFLGQAYQQLQPTSSMPLTGPSSAILAGNLLWFLSLGFSLSAALGAILVQQWVRFYLQNTQQQRSPKNRARARMYLFKGVQDFGMDAVVGFIPTLLHISLFLFYAGSIAFFRHINLAIFILNIAILGVILGIYAFFTIHPIISQNSPFRTPLSRIIPNRAGEDVHGGVDHIGSANIVFPSKEDDIISLEQHAAAWLLHKVIEEFELEEFLNIINALLKRPPRGTGFDDTLFKALCAFSKPELVSQIHSNVRSFLRTYKTQKLNDEDKKRRIRACEVIAPLFVVGVSKSTDMIRNDPSHYEKVASLSLSVMWCRKDHNIDPYYKISNEELVVKSFIALGWRRKYTVTNGTPTIAAPTLDSDNKLEGLAPQENYFSALYLVKSIVPDPIEFLGVESELFHCKNESPNLNIKDPSIFYHEAVLLFLLAYYHVKKDTAKIIGTNRNRLQVFNMLEAAPMMATSGTVDVFVLKTIIQDLVYAWDQFSIHTDTDKTQIIENVTDIYIKLSLQLTESGTILEVPDAELAISILQKDLSLKPVESQELTIDEGNNPVGIRVDGLEWHNYLEETLNTAKLALRTRTHGNDH